jgi:hypothetical protein
MGRNSVTKRKLPDRTRQDSNLQPSVPKRNENGRFNPQNAVRRAW